MKYLYLLYLFAAVAVAAPLEAPVDESQALVSYTVSVLDIALTKESSGEERLHPYVISLALNGNVYVRLT